MSAQVAAAIKCWRCGTVIETCAFCDRPDCPSITCYRCLAVALLDRLRTKLGEQIPSQKRS